MNLYASILIPVFNESSNIETCIKNLKKQSCQNFEVIFVDDGSTDNSVTILNRVVKDNPNMEIQILQQTNKGAAAARYFAAKIAKHDYVIYHDCDDDISENAIVELLSPFCHNNNLDAALFNLKVESVLKNGQKKLNDVECFSDEKILIGKDCFINSLNGWKIHSLICTKKTTFLEANKIYENYNKSLENYINNDEIIGRIVWTLCSNIIRTDATYYYRCNLKSTTKSINQDFYKVLRNERMLVKIAHKNNIDNQCVYTHQIYMLRFVLKRYVRDKDSIFNKKSWLNEINSHLLWCSIFFIKLPINWKRRYIKIFLQIQWLRLVSQPLKLLGVRK